MRRLALLVALPLGVAACSVSANRADSCDYGESAVMTVYSRGADVCAGGGFLEPGRRCFELRDKHGAVAPPGKQISVTWSDKDRDQYGEITADSWQLRHC